MFTIKYNRTTNHIDGLTVRSAGEGNENGGVVGYYAENACGTLTRSRLATGKAYDDLAEALASARLGRKLCRNCEKAAVAMLEAMKSEEAPEAEREMSESELTEIVVEGKTYLVTPLSAAGEGGRETAAYWATRNGKQFGATRFAYSDGKPGSVGRMLVDAMPKDSRLIPPPVLADGWKEVHHTITGAVVGWLRPGKFRPVEDGMPTA